jgi:hypothetical protein
VSIGDSFTWCMTVRPEDTWTSKLSGITGLSAYNLGLPARGLEEYVELLEEYGLTKQPKYVVMMVYGGNDVRDALKNEEYRASKKAEAPRPAKEGSSCYNPSANFCRVKESLEKVSGLGKSYALNTALAGLTGVFHHRARRKGDLDAVNFRYQVKLNDGSSLLYNPENADQDEPQFAKLVKERGLDPALFDAPLRRFLELSREHRFVPLVVFCPSVYAAYEASVSFQDPTLREPMLRYNAAQAEYFERRAKDWGFAFLDLSPPFRRLAEMPGPRRLLYFPTNVHLTQYAHDQVSLLIARELDRLSAARGVSVLQGPGLLTAPGSSSSVRP